MEKFLAETVTSFGENSLFLPGTRISAGLLVWVCAIHSTDFLYVTNNGKLVEYKQTQVLQSCNNAPKVAFPNEHPCKTAGNMI